VNVTACSKVDGFGAETNAMALPLVFTTWISEAELVRKLPFPVYDIVMVWLPPVSTDVVKVAIPLLSATVPRVFTPSLKVTFPEAPPGVTVAVKVTDCPKLDGFRDELADVVLAARFTV
jgi:hypothetical protein